MHWNQERILWHSRRPEFLQRNANFQIPQLRNMVQKVGMFGMIDIAQIESGENQTQGDQIRGFGFLHDGSVDTVFRFLRSTFFSTRSATVGFQSDQERRDMEDLLFAFDLMSRPSSENSSPSPAPT